MRRAGFHALVALTFILGVLSPVAAGAYTNYSYYYNDYSFNSNNNLYIYACDATTDSTGVYANFYISGSQTNPYRVDDWNGSQSGCGADGPYYWITQHHVCRSLPDDPDVCGPYRVTN